ncbi:MAG TPA: phosphate ABC transporter permease PstA [Kofleriaceae bacterium]|nr:phosphate ABC transporter permease PstA [Kofleriaceae bacterium]
MSIALAKQATSIEPRRRITDVVMRGLCVAATVIALIPLVAVLYYVASKGVGAISWEFFTHDSSTPPSEPGGGMSNAIVGSLMVVGLACAMGIPVGVLTGVYLSELGRDSMFARTVRFTADAMSGIPSIVIGVFTYTLIVLHQRHFSALAGGVALAIIMLPTVTRTTEEMLKLVPDSLREAALALGVPRWKAIVTIVLRTAAPGIATGVMLAIARVAGETAPLIFTAFGNPHVSTSLNQPVGTMPVLIFEDAKSPYDELNRQAAAGALVLVAFILLLNITARLVVRRKK